MLFCCITIKQTDTITLLQNSILKVEMETLLAGLPRPGTESGRDGSTHQGCASPRQTQPRSSGAATGSSWLPGEEGSVSSNSVEADKSTKNIWDSTNWS